MIREIRATGRTEEVESREEEIGIAMEAHPWSQEVTVTFGQEVSSVRLTRDQANSLALMLQEKLWELRGINP